MKKQLPEQPEIQEQPKNPEIPEDPAHQRDKRWIGIDLDGVLAFYDGWKGLDHIGEPVPNMVQKAKQMIMAGLTVKIFTARVSKPEDAENQTKLIKAWCLEHIGLELEVTCIKDYGCIQIWDDRAITVIKNTGMALGLM